MTAWNSSDLSVRVAEAKDAVALTNFSCSLKNDWEDEVENQIRGPLPPRYLGTDPLGLDPRLLVCTAGKEIVAVAGHHVEPLPIERNGEVEVLRPTYVEVVAVALRARRTSVIIADDDTMSVGEYMFEAVITDVLNRTDRDPYVFTKVHRLHAVSLEFCDRVGLTIEKSNVDPRYVQRWGDLA